MVCRVMVTWWLESWLRTWWLESWLRTWWLESCYRLHIIMPNTLAGVMLKCVWSHANMAHGVMLTWCVESSYSTLIKWSQLSYDRCHDLERVCNIYTLKHFTRILYLYFCFVSITNLISEMCVSDAMLFNYTYFIRLDVEVMHCTNPSLAVHD